MEWGTATGLAACGVDWNEDKYIFSDVLKHYIFYLLSQLSQLLLCLS